MSYRAVAEIIDLLLLLWLKPTQHIDSFDTDPREWSSLYAERQTGAAGGSVNVYNSCRCCFTFTFNAAISSSTFALASCIFHPLLFFQPPHPTFFHIKKKKGLQKDDEPLKIYKPLFLTLYGTVRAAVKDMDSSTIYGCLSLIERESEYHRQVIFT